MKIAIITSMKGFGGTETVSLRIIKLLKNHGHEVSLLSCHGPLVKDAINTGASWNEIKYYDNGIIGYIKSIFLTYKFIKKLKPEILHCQMARPVLACRIAGWISRVNTKVIWHSRGLNSHSYPKICRIFSLLGIYAIANCKHEKEKLIRHHFRSDRVFYTYNPLPLINKNYYRQNNTNFFTMGSLSRLSSERNVGEAILILHEIIKKGYNFRLIIGGDGDELDNLKQLTTELGLTENVTFLGRVTDISVFFSQIDVLINTISLAGDNGAGVGNNILEAAVYKVPVVTYDSCGASEIIINNLTGYCIKQNFRKDFIDSLIQLSNNQILMHKLGNNLHNHVNTLCSDTAIYNDLYSSYCTATSYFKEQF